MKKLILMLFLLAPMLYAQTSVRSFNAWHKGAFLFGSADSYAILGQNGNQDTSSAISVKEWNGSLILWGISDTTGADASAASDSCLTIYFQALDNDIGTWGGLYSETTIGYTRLDTVNRTMLNDVGNSWYFPLALEDANIPADSVRVILGIGYGDSLYLKIKVAGQ